MLRKPANTDGKNYGQTLHSLSVSLFFCSYLTVLYHLPVRMMVQIVIQVLTKIILESRKCAGPFEFVSDREATLGSSGDYSLRTAARGSSGDQSLITVTSVDTRPAVPSIFPPEDFSRVTEADVCVLAAFYAAA